MDKKKKRLVSRRDIAIEIFELDNGNALVEARFLDPSHLISLDLEIDPRTRTVIGAKSEMPNGPYRVCHHVCDKAVNLKGAVIQRGVMKEITKRIGGGDGCVHLRELASEAINFCATALIGYEQGFGLMSVDFNSLPDAKRYGLTKNLLQGTCYPYTVGLDAESNKSGEKH